MDISKKEFSNKSPLFEHKIIELRVQYMMKKFIFM